MPLVLLTVLVIVAAGVGADDRSQGASTPGQDGEVIRKTIRSAIRQVTDGNATRACRYITAAGHARMISAYVRTYERPFTSCAQIVRFERREDPSSIDDARHARIGRARMRDGGATVVVRGPGRYPPRYPLHLVRDGDSWKVDDADYLLPAGR
jgi:hypothetical protein